jgi:uncharacterized protein
MPKGTRRRGKAKGNFGSRAFVLLYDLAECFYRKMKTNPLRFLSVCAFVLLGFVHVFSQGFSINESPLPVPTAPVMDYAGVLDPATKKSLQDKIIAFRDSTNPKVELAVAIVTTTGDRPIFDYSLAVARGWKIGSKEDDNPGALLFIAINDKKYFTQVSKDLEDELPDGLVGQLQRQYLVPAFKQQNYAQGVSDTIDAYIRTIQAKQSGEPISQPPAGRTAPRRSTGASNSLCSGGICLIIIFILLISVIGRATRPRGGLGSGWRGGGFGGSVLPWVAGSIISGALNSSGGSSGGSDGGSGGDSWGGFGGGGDFGGGGAGGDW